jgi:hypothetical protein
MWRRSWTFLIAEASANCQDFPSIATIRSVWPDLVQKLRAEQRCVNASARRLMDAIAGALVAMIDLRTAFFSHSPDWRVVWSRSGNNDSFCIRSYSPVQADS